MLSLAHRLVSAPLCAARSLSGSFRSRFGAGSASHSLRQSSAPASAAGRDDAASPTWHFGPKVPWDSARDGDVIDAEAMCAAFSRAGFPRTKTLQFKAGHVLREHAHNKKGYKRVGVAEGGKFLIRPKAWSGDAAEASEAAVRAASLSDIELSPGDSVDIPPGLVHSAWVVGDEGIVFIMGDVEEE